MRSGTERQGTIMSRHREIPARHVLPEKGRREVNCVERTEFRRHRLCGSFEDHGVDFHQFKGGDQPQDRSPAARDFRIVEAGA